MKNIPASVHARLLNLARREGVDANSLLDRYGAERLLYRLAQSRYSAQFILKGAQLLLARSGSYHRPTRDIDFLGIEREASEKIAQVFREICAAVVVDDGLDFTASTVEAQPIRESDMHGGIRVRLIAYLGSARIPLQIDIGFGDAITPGPEPILFPTLLDSPPPILSGYPIATVIAEKLESLTSLGVATTRMKDVYDLWFVLSRFNPKPEEAYEAIRRTFARRNTRLDPNTAVFTNEFWSDDSKQTQWTAFRRRSARDAPDLERACTFIRSELLPLVLRAIATQHEDGPEGP